MARTLVQNWIAQTYDSRVSNSSSKRLLNGYIQSTEGEGKFPSEVIGTPGTATFTRKETNTAAIVSIQGNGGFPNLVTVNTTIPHNLIVGEVFTVQDTTYYDELELVVLQVLSPTQFTYETYSNQETIADTSGSVAATGESPIEGIPADSTCRGLYTTSNGRVFAAYSSEVYEIFIDGTWQNLTTIGAGSSPVSFADDGFSLVFVDGSQMYVYNYLSGAVNNITSSLPFTNPTKVVFSNARIVCINDGTERIDTTINTKNRFYFTEVYNAGVWDVLAYASAESSADPISALEIREGELWFFGPRSYEVWRAGDNPDLPFNKVGGSSTEIGCSAPNSVANIAGQVFWLGSSTAGQNVIFMSNGYSAARISTHAIEYALSELGPNTNDAVGFAYQQEGHTFYCLTLIQGNKTFVFDLATKLWHERSSRDVKINKENYWEVLYTTSAFNQVLCGGLKTARILTLDLNKYTEWDGRPIVRLIRGPIIFQNLGQLFHYRFDVDMETGIGLQQGQPYQSGIQTGQGADPVVMLRHSDDGGHTWSSQRRTSAGKVGQYQARVSFRRLGRSRERVYELSMSDPVKWHILGARVSAKPGMQP